MSAVDDRIELLREMLCKAGDGNGAAEAIRSMIPTATSDVRKAFVESLSSSEEAFDIGAWHGMRLAIGIFERWLAMTNAPPPAGRFTVHSNPDQPTGPGSMEAGEYIEGRWRKAKEDGGSCNG